MFGSRLFRNRWAALLWAGGILWFAHDVASGSSGTAKTAARQADATGTPVDQADLATIANAVAN